MITAVLATVMIIMLCFCGACAGVRFERALPLCTCGIAAALFLSGLAGSLAPGFFLILALSVGAPVFFAVRTVQKKKLRGALARLFTPSFFCFISAAVVIIYCYYGKLAYMWDEVDHWVYVVKAMAWLDDFGTNSAAHDMYASYPPAMALFQYFYARLDRLLRPGREFTEWLCWYSFHIFAVSLLLPLFPGFGGADTAYDGYKKYTYPLKNAVFIILMEVLSATVFRQEIFSVLIDPFVGLATGAGFIAVIFTGKKDRLYRVYICLLCAVLALSKDVGLAAGASVAAAYLADEAGRLISRRPSDGPESGVGQNRLITVRNTVINDIVIAALPLVLALCAKALWSLELRTSGAAIQFGNKVDYLEYAKIFFFGGGSGYQNTMAETYKNELLHGEFIGFGGIRLSIAAIYIGSCIAAAALLAALKLFGHGVRRLAVPAAIALIYCGLYIFNVGAVYMYSFEDYEALELASLWRYAGIALLPALMLCAVLALYAAEKAAGKASAEDGNGAGEKAAGKTARLPGAAYTLTVYALAAVMILGLSAGSEAVREVVSRRNVSLSHELRAPYETISDRIKSECSPGDRIYMIRQGADNAYGKDGFYDNMVVRMNVFPVITGEYAHSLGTPESEEDNREDIPYEQWLGDILDNYDYVAVCAADRQLEKVYGKAFEGGVQPDALYKTDRDKKVLVR